MQSEYPNTGYNGIPRDEIPNSDWEVRKDCQGQLTSKLRKTEGLVRNSVKGWRLEERHWHPGELAFWMEQRAREAEGREVGGISRVRSQPLTPAWNLVIAQEGFVCAANESAHFMDETHETGNVTACWARKEPRAAGSQHRAHPLRRLFDWACWKGESPAPMSWVNNHPLQAGQQGAVGCNQLPPTCVLGHFLNLVGWRYSRKSFLQ